jgi:hypothetical protein
MFCKATGGAALRRELVMFRKRANNSQGQKVRMQNWLCFAKSTDPMGIPQELAIFRKLKSKSSRRLAMFRKIDEIVVLPNNWLCFVNNPTPTNQRPYAKLAMFRKSTEPRRCPQQLATFRKLKTEDRTQIGYVSQKHHRPPANPRVK